jgi:O-antigen ligase
MVPRGACGTGHVKANRVENRHGKQVLGRLVLRLIRTSDQFARHNYAIIFLLAIGASVLGSGFTVLVWGCFAWNAVSWVLGRLPRKLPRTERMFCLLIAAYPAALLLTSIAAPAAFAHDWIRKILPLIVFLAPVILLKRFGGLPHYRYKAVFVNGAIIGCAASALISIATQLFAYYQPEGLAGNSYPFAMAALLSGTFAALAFPLRHPLSMTGVIALCLSFVAVLLSESRAVMACLPLVALVVAWRHHWRLGPLFKHRGFVTSLVLAALALAYFAPIIKVRMELIPIEFARYDQENDTTSSLGKRLAMWEGGWLLAKEAPILGYGVQNRDTAIRQAGQRATPPAELTVRHFHNFILTALIDGGIVVLVAMFATLLAPVYYAWSVRRPPLDRSLASMAIALPLIYMVGGLSALTFGHDILDALFVFLACFLIFANRADGTDAAISAAPPSSS